MNIFNGVYQGKKILVTGHTGFKGSWLCTWLTELGAEVIGVGLDPDYENHPYDVLNVKDDVVDLRKNILDLNEVIKVFKGYQPDFVIHFAAQPIVRSSYLYPVETYMTNLNGTLHVLEALRQNPDIKGGIFVTTDKIYHNNNWFWAYREIDPKGGYDPYSSSKACCELVVDTYRNSYFKHSGQLVATTRTGNTLGGGDWAKDRIVPDCIRACAKEKQIVLRNPQAVRPWQYVLEPLSFYLALGEKLLSGDDRFSEPWNAGPQLDALVTVRDIASLVVKYWGKGSIVSEAEPQNQEMYESNYLNVDVSKAFLKLKWKSTLNIEETIRMTVAWYKEFVENGRANMRAFTVSQINEYISLAQQKNIAWSKSKSAQKELIAG